MTELHGCMVTFHFDVTSFRIQVCIFVQHAIKLAMMKHHVRSLRMGHEKYLPKFFATPNCQIDWSKGSWSAFNDQMTSLNDVYVSSDLSSFFYHKPPLSKKGTNFYPYLFQNSLTLEPSSNDVFK